MNDKKFNKIFSTVLMTLMVVVIAITTAFNIEHVLSKFDFKTFSI